jgi:hypothetical protein
MNSTFIASGDSSMYGKAGMIAMRMTSHAKTFRTLLDVRFPKPRASIEQVKEFWRINNMHSFRKIYAFLALGTALAITPAMKMTRAETEAVDRQTADVESVSGRITSVQGNTFTLEISTTQKGSSPSRDNKKSLTLTIDQDTDVTGKIVVDADANATYRVQDGNNVAVSVRIVRQPS